MVEKNNIFNFKPQSTLVEKINKDNSNGLIIGNNNNKNDDNKNSPDPKHKYVKILVNDPFNNRDIILKVTKKQKGVYI
jgi:hypothetical protein